MLDITAIGELLIDFTPAGLSENGMPLFAQNPGGAPANVLVAAANLDMKTAFIGKVGLDEFGKALSQVLDEYHVDTKGLVKDPDVETTLAFVHLHPDGDRDFSFYRSRGADKFLTPSDVDYSILDDTKILHFGSLSLTDEPSRSTTLQALDYALAKSKLISYDPNWRPPLWKSAGEGLTWMRKGLEYAHVVKMSEEEISLIAGTTPVDIPAGIKIILDTYVNIQIMAVTMGKDGCYIVKREKNSRNGQDNSCIQNTANNQDIFSMRLIPGVTHVFGQPVKAVDATGAGDCFTGAMLTCILKNKVRLGSIAELENIDVNELAEYARYANHAAALCVTKKGGIPSMPKPADLDLIL